MNILGVSPTLNAKENDMTSISYQPLWLLNEKQVAEMLGLKPATLRVWRATGRGPRYLKVGGSVRYDIDEVKDYLREMRRQPISVK